MTKTYSTTEILIVAKATGYYWRLDYLVRKGAVVALNRVRGQERRFTEQEALRAINILRAGSVSNVKDLQELANNAAQPSVSELSGPETG